jgi:uncharacterized protein
MTGKVKLRSKDLNDLVKKLKKLPKDHVDQLFHPEHEAVFKKTDCLTCANCCKTTSPIFTTADIQRISKLFRQKPNQFIDQYLFRDSEGDFVLRSAPCPFLNADNKCFIYEERPSACREYPHTNRKNMQQILGLTVNNAEICPAVTEILNRIIVKKLAQTGEKR